MPEFADERGLGVFLSFRNSLKESDGGDGAGNEEEKANDEANHAVGEGEGVLFGFVEVDGTDFGEGDVEGGLDGAEAFATGNATIGAGTGDLVGGAKGFAEGGAPAQRGLASLFTPFARSFEVDSFFGGSGRSPAGHGWGVYGYLGKVKEFSEACSLGFFKEELFERGARVRSGEEFAVGIGGDEVLDLGDELGGGVLKHHFGLVFEGDEFVERALPEHFSLMNNADGIADFLHLLEEVGAEENGDAVGLEVENKVADLSGAQGVDAGGGFVEDEEAGRLNEGLGEADALQHALGIAGETAVSSFGEGGEFEEFLDACVQRFALHSAELAVEFEGFFAGEVFVEIGVFGKIADVFARVGFEGVFAENFAGAAGGGEEAEEGLHCGGFSGAIGANEAVDLAATDGEGDVIDGAMLGSLDRGGELFDEVFDINSEVAHEGMLAMFLNCGKRGKRFHGGAMFKKVLALVGAMMALIGLSGCLEMESTISVNKDGSGLLTEKVVMGAQMVAMMGMGATEGGEDPLAKFSEKSLKAKAAKYGEGVEFVEVTKEEKDGGVSFTTVFKFADISTLKFTPGAMMADEEDLDDEEEDLKMFSFNDGVLTITTPDPSEEGLGLGDDDMSEEEMAMAAPMFAGFKMSAKMVFEGGIDSTNATYHEGNTINLMSMNFDEMMKNEGGFAAMKKLDVESREAFTAAVKELDGIEMESKEKVTVKLK